MDIYAVAFVEPVPLTWPTDPKAAANDQMWFFSAGVTASQVMEEIADAA